jgi:hypothetical protein
MCLSFEIWDNNFSEKNNEVENLFNIFLNRYLKIFISCFPKSKFYERTFTKPGITIGIKIYCQKKGDLYIMTKVNGSIKLKLYYKIL